ncbi:MAG: HDIG domain-containing protein [Chloroflexi bacterium]|nr:HDIG domain-containing protein [Chloroflexota bacterium]
MNRDEALDLVKENVSNQNLLKHMLATEAIMRALARRLEEDEECWALAGLLHDVDYEDTKDDPLRHSLVGAQMLAERGLSPEIVYAVKVHNEAHGDPRKSVLDTALYSGEALTGLIIAAALVRPEKALSAVTVDSVMKRFGEKAFARGANREQIATCSELGLDLREFVEIGLSAMRCISADLGL